MTCWTWGNWYEAAKSIAISKLPKDKLVVIGYSGGGSRATDVANSFMRALQIDLMVLYDPSPKWQMNPIGDNVKNAICYYNTNPMMPSPYGMLGGGRLTGTAHIETIPIAQQHLLVQFNQSLHERTVAAMKQCLATA